MAMFKKSKTTETADEQGKPKKAKAEKKVSTTTEVKSGVVRNSIAYSIMIRPILSEKTTGLESVGQYTFHVHPDANKISVKRAVKEMYGVVPTSVNILNNQGKQTHSGRRTGNRTNWKKAIVTLPKGQKISIHAGV